MPPSVHLLEVFPAGPLGGNPTALVPDATGLSEAEMQDIARSYGWESGFVLPAPDGAAYDFEFRYWVPNHEMEMCGHATVGAVWLLDRLGRLPRKETISILTRSGPVDARAVQSEGRTRVEISQPPGRLEPLGAEAVEAILSVLGIGRGELAPAPVYNARTSRTKTLVPLGGSAILDGLRPDFDRMEQLCEAIGSTGLYPYAVSDRDRQIVDARQFPKAVGYPEDAATGVAAAALIFGLLEDGKVRTDRPIVVRQGRAMGRPSEIHLRFRLDGEGRIAGCWLGGPVRLMENAT